MGDGAEGVIMGIRIFDFIMGRGFPYVMAFLLVVTMVIGGVVGVQIADILLSIPSFRDWLFSVFDWVTGK